MTVSAQPSGDADDRTGSMRRAVDELIRRSGARPIESVEDLDRFKTSLWDSDGELEAFLADLRASRNADS